MALAPRDAPAAIPLEQRIAAEARRLLASVRAEPRPPPPLPPPPATPHSPSTGAANSAEELAALREALRLTTDKLDAARHGLSAHAALAAALVTVVLRRRGGGTSSDSATGAGATGMGAAPYTDTQTAALLRGLLGGVVAGDDAPAEGHGFATALARLDALGHDLRAAPPTLPRAAAGTSAAPARSGGDGSGYAGLWRDTVAAVSATAESSSVAHQRTAAAATDATWVTAHLGEATAGGGTSGASSVALARVMGVSLLAHHPAAREFARLYGGGGESGEGGGGSRAQQRRQQPVQVQLRSPTTARPPDSFAWTTTFGEAGGTPANPGDLLRGLPMDGGATTPVDGGSGNVALSPSRRRHEDPAVTGARTLRQPLLPAPLLNVTGYLRRPAALGTALVHAGSSSGAGGATPLRRRRGGVGGGSADEPLGHALWTDAAGRGSAALRTPLPPSPTRNGRLQLVPEVGSGTDEVVATFVATAGADEGKGAEPRQAPSLPAATAGERSDGALHSIAPTGFVYPPSGHGAPVAVHVLRRGDGARPAWVEEGWTRGRPPQPPQPAVSARPRQLPATGFVGTSYSAQASFRRAANI